MPSRLQLLPRRLARWLKLIPSQALFILLHSQADTSAYLDIVAAKKEAVGLQLEAVYRGRLQEAYTQVSNFIRDECPYMILFKSFLSSSRWHWKTRDNQQHNSRSRKGWTTSWRLPTLWGAWSRNTWWTGLLETWRALSPQPRKTQPWRSAFLTWRACPVPNQAKKLTFLATTPFCIWWFNIFVEQARQLCAVLIICGEEYHKLQKTDF